MELLFRVLDVVSDWTDAYHARGLGRAPMYGEPAWIELRQSLSQGQWDAARAALSDSGTDWVRRFQTVSVAAEWKTEPPWLTEWLEAEPDSADAQLVAGATWMYLAWEARGSGYSNTVSERGAKLFYERLKTARKALLRAIERAPKDPTPVVYLLRVARGLELDAETRQSYFDQAVERDPQHFEAHHEMLQCKCAKWYGSHSEMWSFAREAVAAAPLDSSICSLIPVAHAEHASALVSDAIEKGSDPERAWDGYWQRPEVKRTTVDAFTKMGPTGDASSPDRLQAHSEFAHALWRAGALARAAQAFGQVGDRLTILPWGLNGAPAKTFRRARRECGVS